MGQFFRKCTGYVLPQSRIMMKHADNYGKTFCHIPSLGRGRTQPRCHFEVCETMCPYRDRKWRIDKVESDDGQSEMVVFMKETEPCVMTGCLVAYLKGLAGEVEGNEREFARRHVLRLMDSCPMKMEHELCGWSKARGKRNGKRP